MTIPPDHILFRCVEDWNRLNPKDATTVDTLKSAITSLAPGVLHHHWQAWKAGQDMREQSAMELTGDHIRTGQIQGERDVEGRYRKP